MKLSLSLIGLMAALLALSAKAQNSYAPKLSDVVVLQDIAERDFSPMLFHSIMGETLNMKMDQSCSQVRIVKRAVHCVSSTGNSIEVGVLTKNSRQQEGWIAITVAWSDRVEIREAKTALGLTYSLIVK